MAGGTIGANYSKKIAGIYIFNLVVGVGALALPYAFEKAGLILGLLGLAFMGFVAYICVTYVIEVMACANCVMKKEETKSLINETNEQVVEEEEEERAAISINGGYGTINSAAVLINPGEVVSSANVEDESEQDDDNDDDADRQKISVGITNQNESMAQEDKKYEHPIQKTDLVVKDSHDEDSADMTPRSDDPPSKQQEYPLVKKKKKKRKTEKIDKELMLYNSNPFSIQERVEMGKMADMFLGPIGKIMFYIILVIYLYGDLAIYAVSVPTSLLRVTGNLSFNGTQLTMLQTYYIYLAIFGCVVVPLSFFNFQKTKYIQLATLATRNSALFLMIILCIVFVIEGKGASFEHLNLFNVAAIGELYGATVYSFMCHHSLPSIASPIKHKNNLNLLFGADYFFIFLCYSLLCNSAVFAFGDMRNEKCPQSLRPGPPCKIQSLLTLNFTSYDIPLIGGFLALFPVFTLTTNYPLISITLRNNLQQLFQPIKVAAIPAIGLAFIIQNIDSLVHFTGSYAGLAIQFMIPVLLVFFAQRRITKEFGPEVAKQNLHKSPFSHWIFLLLVMTFSICSLIFNTGWSVYKIFFKSTA